MKLAVIFGFPLTFLGLFFYFPPIVKRLVFLYGDAGRLGGLVLFASGWALLLAYLAFNLGMQHQMKSRIERD